MQTMLVSGCKRVPLPPARMMPFVSNCASPRSAFSVGCQARTPVSSLREVIDKHPSTSMTPCPYRPFPATRQSSISCDAARVDSMIKRQEQGARSQFGRSLDRITHLDRHFRDLLSRFSYKRQYVVNGYCGRCHINLRGSKSGRLGARVWRPRSQLAWCRAIRFEVPSTSVVR